MKSRKASELSNEELLTKQSGLKKSVYAAVTLALLAFLIVLLIPKKYSELASIIPALFLGQSILNLYNL